ncbi:MAG: hypothetical protein PHG41_06500 [Actinomycetota bacterium]|nr:hypothetical protein [Actinomycetota bacterium]
MINYDFQEKINELKSFLKRKEVNIIREAINISDDIDNCYCQLKGKIKDKIINIHLKPYDENSLSIFYSFWLVENKHNIKMSPVVSFSIMDLSSEKVMFGYIINKSFYTFIEMLNIYLKNYKEIEDGEVKFQF